MELALLLVFAVMVELGLTFYLLGKQRHVKRNDAQILKRVQRLEKNVTKLAEVLSDMSYDVPDTQKDFTESPSIADLVAQATPEDVAKANEILRQLGLDD